MESVASNGTRHIASIPARPIPSKLETFTSIGSIFVCEVRLVHLGRKDAISDQKSSASNFTHLHTSSSYFENCVDVGFWSRLVALEICSGVCRLQPAMCRWRVFGGPSAPLDTAVEDGLSKNWVSRARKCDRKARPMSGRQRK